MEWKATGAVLSAVPHLSPGERLRAPVLIANPRSRASNQGSSPSNAGIMFSFLRKPHIYSMMCSLRGSPPVVFQITPGWWELGTKSPDMSL